MNCLLVYFMQSGFFFNSWLPSIGLGVWPTKTIIATEWIQNVAVVMSSCPSTKSKMKTNERTKKKLEMMRRRRNGEKKKTHSEYLLYTRRRSNGDKDRARASKTSYRQNYTQTRIAYTCVICIYSAFERARSRAALQCRIYLCVCVYECVFVHNSVGNENWMKLNAEPKRIKLHFLNFSFPVLISKWNISNEFTLFFHSFIQKNN